MSGPCAFCGCKDAEHRKKDAIRDRFAAGEYMEDIAKDYGMAVWEVRMLVEKPVGRDGGA